MWHVLRVELAYCRPWLLGAWGIALAVISLLSGIFYFAGVGDSDQQAAGLLRAMFPVMAPLVVSYIIQGYRSEERRACLLLAGPLTPKQIATSMVLLPVVLFAAGLLGAGLMIGAEYLITGRLAVATLNVVGSVGIQMFTWGIAALVIQEAVAAYRQRRRLAAAVAWAGLAVATLVIVALHVTLSQQGLTWAGIFLGHLAVAAAWMAGTVALYAGRTDFTR